MEIVVAASIHFIKQGLGSLMAPRWVWLTDGSEVALHDERVHSRDLGCLVLCLSAPNAWCRGMHLSDGMR